MKYFLIYLGFFFYLNAVLFSSPSSREIKNEPSQFAIGIGVFNIVRNKKATQFQLEYRSNYPIYRIPRIFIRPLIGVMMTTKASFYLCGGVAFDLFFLPKCVLTPSFAPGFYLKGKGMDLGFPLEFRSSIELAYCFSNRSRFGAMFYHISNASLGTRNPGTECLVFFYSIPLTPR